MGQRDLALALNGLGLAGLAALLAMAHVLQLALGELPCPLCMLQRVGVVATSFGLLMNVRFGPRPGHYGLVIAGALFGAAAAGRQVLLHIVPSSGAYGSPFLGVHLYTWCLLVFLLAIAATALLLLIERQFEFEAAGRAPTWTRMAAGAMMAMTLMCAISAFVQCGPTECIDDPTSYWLFSVAGAAAQ